MDATNAPVVDCDTHFWQPLELWEQYLDEPYRSAITKHLAETEVVPRQIQGKKAEEATKVRGGDHPDARLEWMDGEGIDACVIFPTNMAHLCYLPDGDLASAACRALNRWSAEFAAAAPGRLKPAMVLPWYHPERALDEFRYAADLGLSVAFTTPTPSPDRRWSDPALDTLWGELEATKTVLTLHEFTRIPGGATVARTSYGDSYPMMYLCGHTVEAQLGLMDLLLGGVFNRFPELRIGLVEAHVAWLPGWLAMMDDQWERLATKFGSIESDAAATSASDLFRRQGFVVAFPNDTWITETIEHVGPEVVTVATDYPHMQARRDLVRQFDQHNPGLSSEVRAMVLGGNAMKLFGLELGATV